MWFCLVDIAQTRLPLGKTRCMAVDACFIATSISEISSTLTVLAIATPIPVERHQNRRPKILSCHRININPKPQSPITFSHLVLLHPKPIRPRLTDLIPPSLHEESNEPSMRDQSNVVIHLRKLFQAMSNALRSRSSTFRTMRRIIPFPMTIREIQRWKFRRDLSSRETFVTDCVVGFAQVRPDLDFCCCWECGNDGWEGIYGGLDGTCHG